MPGTGHGSENIAMNWGDLCSQSRGETDTEEVKCNWEEHCDGQREGSVA